MSMALKNIILGSLHTAKNHGILFTVIVVLQILFFIGAGMAVIGYSQELVAALKEVSNYINEQQWMLEAPTQENLAQLNIPATDPTVISAGRERMLHATEVFFLRVGVLFLVFFGGAWVASYRMVHKHSFRELTRLYGTFLLVASAYLGAIFMLLYGIVLLLTKQFFMASASQTYFFVLPLFTVSLLLYFMPVSFALIDRTSLKEMIHGTLHHGIRQCVFLFLVYGGFLTLLLGLGMLMVWSLNISLALTLLFGILDVGIIALTRIILLTGLGRA